METPGLFGQDERPSASSPDPGARALTDKQAAAVEAVRQHGTIGAAATALGLSPQSVREHLRLAEKKTGKAQPVKSRTCSDCGEEQAKALMASTGRPRCGKCHWRAKTHGVCAECGKGRIASGCSHCGTATSHVHAVDDSSSNPERVTKARLMALIDRQGRRCALSGRDLMPQTTVVDHVHPRARGGSDDMSNMQIVLDVVNRAKQDMTNEEFVSLCRDVVSWADRTKIP